jgi:bla regulator protein blaR1
MTGNSALVLVAGVMAVLAPVSAQTPSAQSASRFEVATVKAVPPPQPGEQFNINLGTVRNGRVTLTNVSLSDCLRFAYGIVSDSQIAGPDWIKSKAARFEIVAQADPGTPREQLLSMLQTLLEERLKLVLHREQKELSYLMLVPAKHGSKLRQAEADASPDGGAMVLGRIVSSRMSMATLAMLLSRFERQTVLDKTGLNDSYEVKLEWNWRRDWPVPPGGDASGLREPSEDKDGPSIFTALEEQLGLKLEARRGPLEVLVVDSAEKVPAEN